MGWGPTVVLLRLKSTVQSSGFEWVGYVMDELHEQGFVHPQNPSGRHKPKEAEVASATFCLKFIFKCIKKMHCFDLAQADVKLTAWQRRTRLSHRDQAITSLSHGGLPHFLNPACVYMKT